MSNTDKKRPGQRIKLTSYDELCGIKEEKAAGEVLIDINQIDDFKNHPFKVIDDEKMDELVESIINNGILSPVIVRNKADGRYELISGHRRRHAAKRAGYTQLPAIIKNYDDEEATVLMVDANIQREEILPSERAKSLKMKMDALAMQKAKGKKFGDKKRELVGADAGLSGRQVQRYLCLNNLCPEILDMIDDKKMQMMVGVEISSLRNEVQQWVYNYISLGVPINLDLVKRLKQVDETEGLDEKVVGYILSEQEYKAKAKRITISETKLNNYFPGYYSVKDMEGVIYQLLEQWKKSQEIMDEE